MHNLPRAAPFKVVCPFSCITLSFSLTINSCWRCHASASSCKSWDCWNPALSERPSHRPPAVPMNNAELSTVSVERGETRRQPAWYSAAEADWMPSLWDKLLADCSDLNRQDPNLLVWDERRCAGVEVVCASESGCRQMWVVKDENTNVCVHKSVYMCSGIYVWNALSRYVCASSSRQPAESSSENLLPPRHDQFSLNATDRWAYWSAVWLFRQPVWIPA